MPEAPSDSTIVCRREWDRTEFRKRLPGHYWFAVLLLVTPVLSGSAMVGMMFLSSLGPGLDRFFLPYLILVGSAGVFVVVPWVSSALGHRRMGRAAGRDYHVRPHVRRRLVADDRGGVAGSDRTPPDRGRVVAARLSNWHWSTWMGRTWRSSAR